MNGTAHGIPGAALSAAANAISGQPAGTSAHLALVALAAAAPLIRDHDLSAPEEQANQ